MALSNAALRTRFQKFARPAWEPQTIPAAPDAGVSRYSGLPLLKAGESWPACGECGKPLQLFLQLDLASIPAAAQERFGAASGILQFFSCTQSPGDQLPSKPFSSAQLLRILPGAPADYVTAAALPEWPQKPAYLASKSIESWKPFDDFPSPEEGEENGMPELSDDEYDTYYMSEPYLNAEGDKLCGWPNWVKDVEYPECPQCGQEMEMRYQLASFGVLSWSWGDVGIGHITQCPTHRDVLAFAWNAE